MERIVVDLAVIGSGPAGQKGAIQGAKLGKKVAVIERDYVPGGACLNTATIPSKSLREAILDLTRYHERSFYGISINEVSLADLNFRLHAVLDSERAVVLRQFKKNNILLVPGMARFLSKNELEVVDLDGKIVAIIEAKAILIGAGSQPRNPLEIPFDHEVILDSTRILTIPSLPKTMIVLGAGIIGSEYASFYSLLGTKVTLLDKRDRVLRFLDKEVGAHLELALKENGLLFYSGKEPAKVERVGNLARVTCTDGSIFEAEMLLYALGRIASVEGLRIERAGIKMNEEGYIVVNEHFQTDTPHIYAAGDVIGFPGLASTSMEQGRLAVRHAFHVPTHPFPSIFPIGIYTIPEISCCGFTEEQLQEKGFHYQVGRAYYYEIARSHITGSSHVGLFKILFHQETRDLLGIHIVGRSATELIHIGQVAILLGAKVDFFVDQVFNYPTFAEGYRIAAINGINKLK